MKPLNEKKTRAFAEKLGYYMPPIESARDSRPVMVMNHQSGYVIRQMASLAELWEAWAHEALWVRNSREIEAAMIRVWKKASPRVRRSIEHYLENEDDNLVEKPWAKQYAKLVHSLPCRRYTAACMPRGWRARFARDIKVHRQRGLLSSERLLAILRASDRSTNTQSTSTTVNWPPLARAVTWRAKNLRDTC